MTNDPNSFDKEMKDVDAGGTADTNPENLNQGTEGENTPNETNPTTEAVQDVDYRKKFAESAREAIRLRKENEALLKANEARGTTHSTEDAPKAESLYPGFEQLDTDAQKNLLVYTDAVTRKAKEEILKDPAINYGRRLYHENRFDSALAKVADKYPDIKNSRDDFKAKYFNPNNIPENIESILEDVAKMYLFDRAKDIGAKEEQAKQSRVDMQTSVAGDKTPHASRNLEDWKRMAQENPVQFAKLSKEYHSDLESGKLKE